MLDLAERKTWFASKPLPWKNLLLLRIANELTLVVRDIATTADKDVRLKVDWIVSECQHRILGYVTAAMAGTERFPDDVMVDILFDHIEHPALKPYAGQVWARAADWAERFGTHLR